MKTLIHTQFSTKVVDVIGTYAKNKQYRRNRAKHWDMMVGAGSAEAETAEHTYTHTPISGYRVRSHVKITKSGAEHVYLLVTHNEDKPIARKTLHKICEEARKELYEAYNS